MYQAEVILDPPVDRRHRSEIEQRLFFVAGSITGFRMLERDGRINGIVFDSDAPLDAAGLTRKVTFLIENDVLPSGVPRRNVVWESASRRAGAAVFDRMCADGIAFPAGEGQVALGEPMVSLMDYLDAELRRMVVERFGAVEYRYPTLVPSRVLDRCGYPGSFPQFLMFVTRLHNDTDVYRSFLQEYRSSGGLAATALPGCGNVDYCLPPTMCFHTFHQQSGHRLSHDELRVVTARGKSFRYESRYVRTLERLWDFTIRETVFLGAREAVLDARERFMRLTFDYLDALGLAGWCETANDPFFCDDETSARIVSQRLLSLKYEVRLAVSTGRDVAVSSFNFHSTFFTERFDIRRDRGDAHSGCAGFGLERLAYAFVCQHGLDPAGWPAQVRSALAGPVQRQQNEEG